MDRYRAESVIPVCLPKKKKGRRVPLNVSVPFAIEKRVARLAQETNNSKSEIVTLALEYALEPLAKTEDHPND